MKKIKSLLLREILSYNDERPTECMYGPPEWYDEEGRYDPRLRYESDNLLVEEKKEDKEKQNKEQMKKIKSLLLREILSYNDGRPTECMYGPPEWYDEEGRYDPRLRYESDNLLVEEKKEDKEKQNKEQNNDRI